MNPYLPCNYQRIDDLPVEETWKHTNIPCPKCHSHDTYTLEVMDDLCTPRYIFECDDCDYRLEEK